MVIDQRRTAEELSRRNNKGDNNIDAKHLNRLRIFGMDDISDDDDYTVILGDFQKETYVLPHKMLVLRPTSLMSNYKYKRVEMVTIGAKIYKCLRGYAGRRCYEVRRVSGCSGHVTNESDVDILRVLHENEGLLARKVYGSVILRGKDRYHIMYVQVNTNHRKIGYSHYSPPRDGGSFNMPKVCSSTFSPLQIHLTTK